MGDDLKAAIDLIRSVTPDSDLWIGADVAGEGGPACDVDEAVAAILNAVADGRLAPTQEAA